MLNDISAAQDTEKEIHLHGVMDCVQRIFMDQHPLEVTDVCPDDWHQAKPPCSTLPVT